MSKQHGEVRPCIVFGVALVDFHHTRGPEVEHWHSDELQNCTWNNLPFQALPDGSHSFEETFTYFTLLYDEGRHRGLNGIDEVEEDNVDECTTLFAISCSRQIKSEELLKKGVEVTRSTVQKSLVVISRVPIFGQIKDKLSIVTNALFLQRDFSDTSIIYTLYDNLRSMFNSAASIDESNLFVGLSLRKIIHDFRREFLVILKAMLLERKIIFYGSNVEELCSLQFGFISLIPNLISNLQDCGSPLLNKYERQLTACDSFKSSDRRSVIRFLGFPLQIFASGGLFSPYTPLQQLGDLTSPKTKWYVIGTSNNLLLEQKDRLADLLVNVDMKTVETISDDKLFAQALQLSHHDRRWMDLLIQNIVNTWNEYDLSTPSTFQFEGSEDFVRWQFEEYLTGLLSSAKLDGFLTKNAGLDMNMRTIPPEYLQESPIQTFNPAWVHLWKETNNYKLFYTFTDDRLFDLFEPKHVFNGVDPLTAWQQKFVKSFKMLNRSETKLGGLEHGPSDPRASDARHTDHNSVNDDRREVDNAKQSSTSWMSWKEYFNTRLKKKPDGDIGISASDNQAEPKISLGQVNASMPSLPLKTAQRNSPQLDSSTPDIQSLPDEVMENPWR
ncbi:AGL180Wp [Eremothecium gossypii ATCC 10895]|uniref:AGL180Wp n=1 Tax=Eremothecium gossypii (strain ATCC 10895 / CBS 109.51 / FGSC 9923 / NRRL Y-1056) TaxID=284811 RepID=Q750W9_EREGS|nr:AGL180Wp [Eremothecium gossypii ATCC 10895]AAS54311.1 AGL180Wp [Eremothecium gossypii ATCC 10895]AEY98637.1 FAGL180Wp [Eremothecium gossypii FDAG1]